MGNNKKGYFASDFHLGLAGEDTNHNREKRIVEWLNQVAEDAHSIYLLGDTFDFWFEYKKVVPRGFVRFLGTLARICDQGIEVYMFKGNHDMWLQDYLEKEIGVKIISHDLKVNINGVSLYMHHGDGIGPGDYGYKFIKAIFRSPISNWLFARIHPNWGVALAQFLSNRSRKSNFRSDQVYLGDNKEYITLYAKALLQNEKYDYLIFGHRHLPLEIKLTEQSTYVNLGEWIHHFTYAELDGKKLKLKTFTGDIIATQ